MRFKFWELIAGVLESSVVSFQDEKLEMSSIFMQHEFFCDSSNIVKYTEDSRRWYKLGITFFYLILWLFSVFGVILLDGSIYSSSKWTSRWFTSVSMISNDAECYCIIWRSALPRLSQCGPLNFDQSYCDSIIYFEVISGRWDHLRPKISTPFSYWNAWGSNSGSWLLVSWNRQLSHSKTKSWRCRPYSCNTNFSVIPQTL